MESKEKILQYMRRNGPSQPTRIAKELGVDSIIASALLANLVSKNIIKVSHMKIGGSPLYYLPGQERNLQKFSDKLPGKEREAYNLIKSEQVVKNEELDPAIRVAISYLKDFAKPITIMLKNQQEMKLWKWYMLSNEDATKIIREKYFNQSNKERKEEKPIVKKIEQKKVESFQEPISQEKIEVEEDKEKERKEQGKEDKKNQEENQKEQEEQKEESNEPQENIPSDIRKAMQNRKLVIEHYEEGKGKDAEMKAHVDGFDRHKIFIYITRKKRINEKDIAMAYLKAELKRIPLIIMHKGDFTKDAEALLKEINAETIKI